MVVFFIVINTSEIWEITILKYIRHVNVCIYKVQHLTSIKQHETNTRQQKTQIKHLITIIIIKIYKINE